jgi:hypothetical protein
LNTELQETRSFYGFPRTGGGLGMCQYDKEEKAADQGVFEVEWEGNMRKVDFEVSPAIRPSNSGVNFGFKKPLEKFRHLE